MKHYHFFRVLVLNMRLLVHSSVYTIGAIIPMLVQLVSIPIIITILGADAYGELSIALLSAQTITTLIGFGVSAAIPRQVILGRDGTRTGAGLVTLLLCVNLLISLLGSLILILLLPNMFNENFIFILVTISAVGLVQVGLVQSFFQGLQKPFAYISIGMAVALMPPIVGLIIATSASRSAEEYYFGFALSHIFLGVTLTLFVSLKFKSVASFNNLYSAIKIGFSTVPHNFAASLVPLSATSVAMLVGGPFLAAGVQFANSIANAPSMIISSINQAWGPELFRTNPENRKSFINSSAFIISVVTSCLVAGFGVFAPIFMPILGPGISTTSVIQLSILIAGAGSIQVLYFAIVNLLFLEGKTGLLALTTPLSVFIGILGLYTIVFIFGFDSPIAFVTVWFLYGFGMASTVKIIAIKRTKLKVKLIAASFQTFSTVIVSIAMIIYSDNLVARIFIAIIVFLIAGLLLFQLKNIESNMFGRIISTFTRFHLLIKQLRGGR